MSMNQISYSEAHINFMSKSNQHSHTSTLPEEMAGMLGRQIELKELERFYMDYPSKSHTSRAWVYERCEYTHINRCFPAPDEEDKERSRNLILTAYVCFTVNEQSL